MGDHDLITLTDLKDFLGLTDITHDILLSRIIERVSSVFDDETRRKLAARDYTYDSTSADYDPDNAVLDGNGRDRLALPQYPVNSLSTLKINTFEIDERADVFSTGWVLDRKNGIITLAGYLFTEGLSNIDLVYNAGYATVPADLEGAAVEQSAWVFKQSTPGGALLGVSGKTLADGSIQFTSKELLPSVRATIERYKKRFAL